MLQDEPVVQSCSYTVVYTVVCGIMLLLPISHIGQYVTVTPSVTVIMVSGVVESQSSIVMVTYIGVAVVIDVFIWAMAAGMAAATATRWKRMI